MSLPDRIQKDTTEAMKSKPEARLSAVRMMKAALSSNRVVRCSRFGLTSKAEA